MTNQSLILPSLLCAALVAFSGCGKQDGPAANSPAGGAVEKAVSTAQAQTEVVKQKAQEVVTNVQAQAAAVAGQAQALVDQAKKLIGENKWPEALAMLNKLPVQSLPADLQATVQSLKEQAQKGVESMASAKNAGGLLPK
jgi:formate dehydrogenase maturation protein FdhE